MFERTEMMQDKKDEEISSLDFGKRDQDVHRNVLQRNTFREKFHLAGIFVEARSILCTNSEVFHCSVEIGGHVQIKYSADEA